jgi:hypothetical protein
LYLLPDATKSTKRKSRVHKRTAAPIIDETFSYPLPAATATAIADSGPLPHTLRVAMWTSELAAVNVALGQLDLIVDEVVRARHLHGWFPLSVPDDRAVSVLSAAWA